MSQFRSQLIREVVGPGAHTEDGVPVPKQFRQIPIENGGVPPTTPAGARQPTGSPVSKTPLPQ